jgi:hypothetical protein
MSVRGFGPRIMAQRSSYPRASLGVVALVVHRGTVESRPEPKWSLGTDTYLSGTTRMAIVWEFSAVTDPGDLERTRLLFQWATKHISSDEFERRWNEIRDQPELGTDGKPLFASTGRPVMGAARCRSPRTASGIGIRPIGARLPRGWTKANSGA